MKQIIYTLSMKKIVPPLFIILMLTSDVDAKIWRVNNNAGVIANFTSAQAAHNGAAAGDTLHFEPSINSYGDVTMSKRLILIGTGDFLDENPNNQTTVVAARLGYIRLSPGSDNSTIMVSAEVVYIEVGGIIVHRCNIYGGLTLNTASNSIITNCYIRDIHSEGNPSLNVQIINNLIYDRINLLSGSSATIINNVINVSGGSTNNFHNSTFKNNILNKSALLSYTNSTIENNLTSNSSLPTGNSNLNNVNMSAVFVDANSTVDKKFMLKTDSPAIGAGAGGVDAGAFGGPTPYKLAVQPNVPAIYKLVAPSVVSGNTMQISISTKANN